MQVVRLEAWLDESPGPHGLLLCGHCPGSLGICCSWHLSPLPRRVCASNLRRPVGVCLCLSRDIVFAFHFPAILQIPLGRGAGWCLVSFLVCALSGVSCRNDTDPRHGGGAPAGLGTFRAAWKLPSSEARELHPPATGPPRHLLGTGGCWEDFPAGMGSSFFQGCSLFS